VVELYRFPGSGPSPQDPEGDDVLSGRVGQLLGGFPSPPEAVEGVVGNASFCIAHPGTPQGGSADAERFFAASSFAMALQKFILGKSGFEF
jgi:hypothetical protein